MIREMYPQKIRKQIVCFDIKKCFFSITCIFSFKISQHYCFSYCF